MQISVMVDIQIAGKSRPLLSTVCESSQNPALNHRRKSESFTERIKILLWAYKQICSYILFSSLRCFSEFNLNCLLSYKNVPELKSTCQLPMWALLLCTSKPGATEFWPQHSPTVNTREHWTVSCGWTQTKILQKILLYCSFPPPPW